MITRIPEDQRRAAAGRPWLTGRILVGVDGSHPSTLALERAAQIAKFAGAHLEVVSVWKSRAANAPVMGPSGWSDGDGAHTSLQQVLVAVFGRDIPETLVAYVHEGSDAAALIELSEGADLLVVGRHGNGGKAGALLGSVSAACARGASCPVLVVPDDGAQRAR